jgi:OOP family OmpA-OmpF porin
MKKTTICLAVSAAFLFAGNSEITGVVGGAHPFNKSKFEDHMTYGLRMGAGIDSVILDQLEVGYDYSRADYERKQPYLKDKTTIHRIYLNGIKEFQVASKTKLYGLLGVGYEDFKNSNLPTEKDGAFGQYGLGVKQYLGESLAIRGEVRHAIKFDHPHRNYLFYTLGLAYSFGAKAQAIVVEDKQPIVETQTNTVKVVEEQPAQAAQVEEPQTAIVEQEQPKPAVVETIQEKEIQGTVVKKVVLTNQHLNFNTNSASISAQGEQALQQVAEDLKSYNNDSVKILVGGHTDSTGSEQYNLKLSQKRAQVIKDELVSRGVAEDKIVAKGYGEAKPIKSNKTAEGRAANRRAEVIFVQ